MDMKYILKLH